MFLDYAKGPTRTARARRLVLTAAKLLVAVLSASAALRIAYGHGYRDGYCDGGEAERVRHLPPPTPLAELVRSLQQESRGGGPATAAAMSVRQPATTRP